MSIAFVLGEIEAKNWSSSNATRVFPHVGANASGLDETTFKRFVYGKNNVSTIFEADFHSKNCILAISSIFVYLKYKGNQ